MNRVATRTALVALVLGLSQAGCGAGEAKIETGSETAAAPLQVAIGLPERGDIFAHYETTASIAADADAPVPARVAGQVVEILAEEGDPVRKGQPLARLDGERLRLRMLENEARLQISAREFERLKQLRARGLVSAAAVEAVKFDLDARQASFNLSRLDYDYTTIRAPIDGVVAARHIKPGNQVSAGEAAFRITDTRRLVARLLIPQAELAKVSVGDAIFVTADAVPGKRFRALIARVSPTIDITNGTFRATAYIDNSDGHLVPGMFGRFTIAHDRHPDALLIPETAVVREDSDNVVYVVVDGIVSRRPVQLGLKADDHVEILDGLHDDEPVVLNGGGSLRDGSKVLAQEPPPGHSAG